MTLHQPTAPSAPPTSVTASEVTTSTMTVQWGPVDCIHRNGDITGYSVQFGSENVSVSGDSSGGMYVISGLMPSTNYSFQVAAETRGGIGPYSAAVNQLTAGMIIIILYLHENVSIYPQLRLQSCQLLVQQLLPYPSPGLVLAQRLLAMR